MRVGGLFRWRLALLVAALSVFIAMPARADDGITLEIDAASVSVASGSWTGHAFLCVRYKLNQGTKEDCYGFYPATAGFGMIFGPGIVSPEPTPDHPDRFAQVAVSVQKSITLDQRRAILRSIDTWNSAKYNITDRNCIDFIDNAARLGGMTVPDRTKFQFPVDYVTLLATLNP
jgi:hypothetical protein